MQYLVIARSAANEFTRCPPVVADWNTAKGLANSVHANYPEHEVMVLYGPTVEAIETILRGIVAGEGGHYLLPTKDDGASEHKDAPYSFRFVPYDMKMSTILRLAGAVGRGDLGGKYDGQNAEPFDGGELPEAGSKGAGR